MFNFFISSTFSDMHAERDIIFSKILPEIKTFGYQHGQEVYVTDLRWGINTLNMSAGTEMNKILSICMAEIDRCRPHIIIMLGDRYGSQPEQAALDSLLSGQYGKLFQKDAVKGKSVTELEIIHGLQHHFGQEPISVTICLRTPLAKETIPPAFHKQYFCQNEEEKKMQQLKGWLVSTYPDYILYYDAIWNKDSKSLQINDAFKEKLIARLVQQMKETFPEMLLSPEQQQWNYDIVFQRRQHSVFSGQTEYLDQIEAFMQDPSNPVLLLHGASGMGKSTLLAKISQNYQDACAVVCLFCGNGKYLTNSFQLLKNLVWRLKAISTQKEDDLFALSSYEDHQLAAEKLIAEIAA